MKTLEEWIAKSDEIGERIRTLLWAKEVFVDSNIKKHIPLLREECGFANLSEEAQEAWIAFEETLAVRDAADLLRQLRILGAFLGHFIEVFNSPNGGSISRTLRSMNPRKSSADSPINLPGNSRN